MSDNYLKMLDNFPRAELFSYEHGRHLYEGENLAAWERVIWLLEHRNLMTISAPLEASAALFTGGVEFGPKYGETRRDWINRTLLCNKPYRLPPPADPSDAIPLNARYLSGRQWLYPRAWAKHAAQVSEVTGNYKRRKAAARKAAAAAAVAPKARRSRSR